MLKLLKPTIRHSINCIKPRKIKQTLTHSIQTWRDFNDYTVSEVKIDVPGGQLAGKLWKPNKNLHASKKSKILPTICAHGWLDNAGTFDTLLPHLMTTETTYFALDFPGHGLTTYCPLWFYDGHVEGIISIKRVMAHFGWEKINLLGHSMGGIIGFIFSSLFPEDVDNYMALENMRPLINYQGLDTMRHSINLVFEVEGREAIPRKSYPFPELLSRFYEGRQESVSLDGCQILLKRGAVQNDAQLWNYSYNFRTLIPGQEGRYSEEMCKALASKLKANICFIKAESGNVYDEEESISEFLKIIEANIGKEKIERHNAPGNHHFHLDNPLPVAKILRDFMHLDMKTE